MTITTTSATMKAAIRVGLAVPLLAVAAACGSDSDTTGDDAGEDAGVATTAGATGGGDGDPADATAPGAVGSETTDVAEAPSEAPQGTSGGTATLTLENGESFEFSGLLCTLEPQMSAGSEILFTAVSYGDPGLDVTQFGDEGTITDVASISVYDGEYNTLWDASTMFGSPVELTLDGSTITGTGSFLEGGEMDGAPVEGELVANC